MQKRKTKGLHNIAKMFLILVLCLALMAGLNGKVAYAQTNRQTIKIAFTRQDGLMNVDELGKFSGYTYEYIMKIAQYAGFNVQFVIAESKDENDALAELLQKTTSGEIDVIGSLLYDENLAETLDYASENYGFTYTTLCALSDNEKISQYSLTDKKTFKIAVQASSVVRREELIQYCAQNGISYELVECDSEAEQLEKLNNGEVDLMLTVSLTQLKSTKTVAEFMQKPFYFASTKGNQEIIDKIDYAIRLIDQTQPQFRENLHNKYFPQTIASSDLSSAEKEYIKKKKTIDVLFPYEIAPLLYTQKGESKGFFVEFCNYLSNETGFEVVYHKVEDGMTMQQAVEKFDCDLILGVKEGYEYALNRDMIFSETILEIGTCIYFRQNVSLGNLKDYTQAVAVTAKSEYDNGSRQELFLTLSDCIAAVERGDAQYGYGPSMMIEYEIEKNSFSNITTLPVYNSSNFYCVAFQNDADVQLMTIVNKVIRGLDSATIDSFISASAGVGEQSLFSIFIKRQPIVFGSILTGIAFLFVILIIALIDSKSNRKKTAELKKAIKRADDANKTKAEFFARISHDMRTPMNGIIGMTMLTREIPNLPNEAQENLSSIYSSSMFLLNLINDSLEINKIENKKIELHEEPVLASEFIAQLLNEVKPTAKEKNIELTVTPKNAELEYILTDKIRLHQIFINLLSNAVKFTPQNGKVELIIECLRRENGIAYDKITVKDNGVGMSESFAKRAFEPFMQEKNVESENYAGTGLGLAIVKNLVELMNGKIELRSELGRGTTIDVYLNFKRVYDFEPPKKKEVSDKSKLCGKKVLLVEDHPINATIAERFLKNVGIEVVLAKNGQEGLDVFSNSKENEFDGVLMDIRMPVMDGLSATRYIRALPRSDAKTVPIIAMTANAFYEDVQKCLDAGMDAHMAKPIDPEKMFDLLYKYL